MVEEHATERSIFLNAIDIASDDDRSAYLDHACGTNGEMREAVEKLLGAHHTKQRLLDMPDQVQVSTDEPASELIGTSIGPYKLLEVIGEGGFGVVFLAEQIEPVRRQVALKIIKPGMDSKQVIARFEAERQALAMMDHANIAKVFDGGTVGTANRAESKYPAQRTAHAVSAEPQIYEMPDRVSQLKLEATGPARGLYPPGGPKSLDLSPFSQGRPYFVMELVKGVPIHQYCDECRLSIRERLQLFTRICQAVQHAHQKGIIHRDLKPSNVLIAMEDGHPAPKIIDFGVAKAIGHKLTDHTVRTQFTQMIGTPMYMSPEQAELSPIDIDTRSDIYSLGVLLYELLTGTTPFASERLKSASFDELRRIIREENPPRPSVALSTLKAEAVSTVANTQRTVPRQLITHLRGDLDWIVMKALEKDRARRYQTANELAADIERHLADEPVYARPQSKTYRLKKLIHKHCLGVSAAVAVLITALTGGVLATMGFARAVQQRDIAEAQRDIARANLHLGCKLFDEMAYPIYWQIANSPQTREARQILLDKSFEFYNGLDEEALRDPTVRHGHASVLVLRAHALGLRGQDSIDAAEAAQDLLLGLVEEYPENARYRTSLARALGMVGNALRDNMKFTNAESHFAHAVKILQPIVRDHPDDGYALWRLVQYYGDHGHCLHRIGRLREAESQLKSGLSFVPYPYPPGEWEKDHRLMEGVARLRLSNVFFESGRFGEAKRELERVFAIAREGVAKAPRAGNRRMFNHVLHMLAVPAAELAMAYQQNDDAQAKISDAIASAENATDTLPDRAFMKATLASLYDTRADAFVALGRFDEARDDYRKSLSILGKSESDSEKLRKGVTLWRLGELDYLQQRFDAGNTHLNTAQSELEGLIERHGNELYLHQPIVAFLCTCPNAALRDPHRAARLAESLVSDSNAPMWRYLALAHYRTGKWAKAESAIRKSMELRSGGDPLDWLLLAGIQQGAGRTDAASNSLQFAEQGIATKRAIYFGLVSVTELESLLYEIQTEIALNH